MSETRERARRGAREFSCADCVGRPCRSNDVAKFPSYCLTAHVDPQRLQESLEKYDDKDMGHMARVCASVESDFYCRLNRVAETIEFIKRMQYREVGIATCVGLMPEARLFSGLLQASGISHYTVGCKIGAMDKTTIGIPENQKLNGGDGHESMCNPVMQAMVLNDRKTDFNILIGLCVGHDSLFIQHSRAPVSVMIVKDRVLGHNPVAALYNVGGMYSSFKEIGK